MKGRPIFTYRDERKLFALISIIIVAALVALVQINAERTGSESPIATVATSLFGITETAISTTLETARSAALGVIALPGLAHDNQQLRRENRRLIVENARLHQLAATYASEVSIRPAVDLYHGIEARVVGFPPENESQAVTIDKGSIAGVARDDGVVTADGVVGRVASVGPLTSSV
ncbi:MAG TPA: rod shape-determining protein MreC, partial [Candidatus Baltobacteraceae bacterium]|nr:rod shape-determining protein MreC [Candidatus Baltobacteraceae bacterium]